MNEIDFLPEGFLRTKAHQRSTVRHVVLLAIGAVCMVGWTLNARHDMKDLEAYRAVLENKQAAIRLEAAERAKLQDQINVLADKLRVRDELTLALTNTRIIAALSQLTPASIAMFQLQTSYEPPPLIRPAADQSSSRSAPPQPARWDYLSLSLDGYAPSGVEIANLIGVLEAHPLFDKIKMKDNRPQEVGDLIARRFHLDLRVPLDRDYQPTTASPRHARGDRGRQTEIAHAD